MEDALRQSQSSFMKNALKVNVNSKEQVLPTINRRLGGGLAAVVKMKMVKNQEEKKTQKNILSDDDSYYDQ